MKKMEWRNQFGYGRLTTGTVSLIVVVLSVLIYQISLTNPFSINETPADIHVIESVQVFPQTLPVLDDVGYLLSAETPDDTRIDIGVFYHRESGILVDGSNREIQEGLFTLPNQVDAIESVSLALYDNQDLQDPTVIPFLTGDIVEDRALVSFLREFDDAADNRFMLGTPTDNNSLINERSGIWFGDLVQGIPQLNLPQLPNGWIYEGWAIIDDQPLTTGKFARTTVTDLFSGFSDTQAPLPSFPGEDFLLDPPIFVFPDLVFPVDLSGQQVAITIEPNVSGADPTGQGPFPMKILQAEVPRLGQAGVLYDLDYALDNLPKATVVLR